MLYEKMLIGGFNLKTTKLTSEQLETMSYSDVAYLVLSEEKRAMKIQELFSQVLKLMELPESYFEKKIADFFALLSTDKKFIMLEQGFWDLRVNHSNKITLSVDDEEEEEEEEIELTEEDEYESMDEEDEDSEINYDDEDTVDDDDDDYKDLVIINSSDEPDDMM